MSNSYPVISVSRAEPSGKTPRSVAGVCWSKLNLQRGDDFHVALLFQHLYAHIVHLPLKKQINGRLANPQAANRELRDALRQCRTGKNHPVVRRLNIQAKARLNK